MYDEEVKEYPIDNMAAGLRRQIEDEVNQYLTEEVTLSEGNKFSQYKLVRRIGLFESHVYPNGKIDKQGNYKYWYDIILPRVNNEVKNIDFDSKDVGIYSDRKIDEVPNIIANLRLTRYQKDNGKAEEMNDSIEEFSGWGNTVWKKVRGSFERVDLRNFYVINQTARTLKSSPVIERHIYTQEDLRDMMGKWSYVQEVIDNCGTETYKSAVGGLDQKTTVPNYEILERNGLICVKDLKETHREEVLPGDENKYVFGKVIVAAQSTEVSGVDVKYVLWAGELKGKSNADIYREAHRGAYKGRWWREGLYEILFDIQVRSNAIGNQIAIGLEYASKKFFYSPDKLIVNNILTDIKNGAIIRATDLRSVDVRMEGLDQLIADWNRLMQLADALANSHEIATGEALPSGTPFRLGALYNQNTNKLFDFLREKLSIPLSQIYNEWVVPEMVKEITVKDVLRLTGDSDMLRRLKELIVDDWYLRNLLEIGPHSPEEAVMLKSMKMMELDARPQMLVKGLRKAFEDYAPEATVEISGENSRKSVEMETYSSFIQLEADPVRRSYLIEKAMKRGGIDVGSLPRLSPEQLAPQGPATTPAPTANAPA